MYIDRWLDYNDLLVAVDKDIRNGLILNLSGLVNELCLVDKTLQEYMHKGASVAEKGLPDEIGMYYWSMGAGLSYHVLNMVGFTDEDFVTDDLFYVDLTELSSFMGKYDVLSAADEDVGLPGKFYDEIMLLKSIEFIIDPMIDGVKSAGRDDSAYMHYVGMLVSIKDNVDDALQEIEAAYRKVSENRSDE